MGLYRAECPIARTSGLYADSQCFKRGSECPKSVFWKHRL